jgi:hypothetical protein
MNFPIFKGYPVCLIKLILSFLTFIMVLYFCGETLKTDVDSNTKVLLACLISLTLIYQLRILVSLIMESIRLGFTGLWPSVAINGSDISHPRFQILLNHRPHQSLR